MQKIFVAIFVAIGVGLLICRIIYAVIMAAYATHIGKTRPMYRIEFVAPDLVICYPYSDSSFKSNFAEYFLPNFLQHWIYF